MPLLPEVLAVKLPKNFRIRKSVNRWLVIKRTCRREEYLEKTMHSGLNWSLVN